MHLTGVFPENYAELVLPASTASLQKTTITPIPRPRPVSGKSTSPGTDDDCDSKLKLPQAKPLPQTEPAPPIKPIPPRRSSAPHMQGPDPKDLVAAQKNANPVPPMIPRRTSESSGVYARPPPPVGQAPTRTIPTPPSIAPPPARQ